MRDLVIGMAGHIDHGKTTLVKKLTGVDTDTLPEEKSRGMTIDIGITQLIFNSGIKVGLIDVPGHEKFIKNMSAGVSGVDFLILVVACDDGIMPQTIEHFEIARLFGVKRGVIALTKRDLVSEERFEEIKLQCQNYFKGSFLENSPLFPLSLTNPRDYENFKSVLEREMKNIELEEDKKYFRMDIDRVFSIKGFGCVVTGTVKSGEVNLEDSLTIYPMNKKVRVKGLEFHGEKRDKIVAGNRCAINLAGIESKEIKRGDIVASKLLTSNRIDCRLNLLSNSNKLKNNHRIRLNIGTDEIIGRVRLYGKNFMLGGESAYVQLQLEEETGAVFGERAIVRNYSPVTTLGGVEVLYLPQMEIDRKDKKYIEFLDGLYTDNNYKRVEEFIKKMDISKTLTFLGEEVDLDNLLKNKVVYTLDKKIIHRDIVEQKLNSIIERLDKFYLENRLDKGILKSKIKEEFFSDYSFKEFSEFFNLGLVSTKVELLGEYIALKNHKIKLSKEEKKMKEEIFSYYKGQKFKICSYSHYLNLTKKKEIFKEIHRYMVIEGFIEPLEEERYILKGFLKESIKLIVEYLEKNSEIKVKEARELLNNDRDSAILILRKLDTLKITKSIDGVRVLNRGGY